MTRKQKVACVVATLFAIPAVALTIEVVKYNRAVGLQEKLEAECMADAEVAVAEYLRAHQPAGAAEFKSISGEGVHGPTPFSPVGFFIQEDCTVQYAGRRERIRICIFPRIATQPDKVSVYLVQGHDYLVAHPRLTGRPTIWGFDFGLPADQKWARRRYEAGSDHDKMREFYVDHTRSTVGMLQFELNDYKSHTGRYPQSLDTLYAKVPGVDDWEGRFLSGNKVSNDAWNHNYHFAVPGKHHPDSFDVWSLGPDGIDGTKDDIGNW